MALRRIYCWCIIALLMMGCGSVKQTVIGQLSAGAITYDQQAIRVNTGISNDDLFIAMQRQILYINCSSTTIIKLLEENGTRDINMSMLCSMIKED